MQKNNTGKYADVKNFLESYLLNKKMIEMLSYEREYFGAQSQGDGFLMLPGGDEVLLRSKMFNVRKFITTLENNNCKLLLYYHYIRGNSVERCAELLGISRTSGFRLKRRALELAADKYYSLFNSDGSPICSF